MLVRLVENNFNLLEKSSGLWVILYEEFYYKRNRITVFIFS